MKVPTQLHVAAIVLTLAIGGCSGSAHDHPGRGTVTGVIQFGGGPPRPPGGAAGELAGTVTVFSTSGEVIASQTVRKGHPFRFVLAAGTYKINAGRQLNPNEGGCAPKTIDVRNGQTTNVIVNTGCSIP